VKGPNVLLISIDTLRADHLTCYGYKRPTSPNIDQLGREGVVYEKAYSTAVWTPPAHASLLTGLYPSSHGAVGENRLRRDIPTLAQVLLGCGYKTFGFINNSQVGELVGLEKGHQVYQEIWKGQPSTSLVQRGINFLLRKGAGIMGVSDHGAHRTNQLAFRSFLDSRDNPFYMFLHYIEPHNPLDPPSAFKARYWKDISLQNIDLKKVGLVANNPLIYFVDEMTLNSNEIEALKALYDAEINYLDQKIGELTDFLKREGIYDETMIILTADHGEHFGEHNLYSHVSSLYEPIIHIPLIIKYPGRSDNGKWMSSLVQLVDVFPTVIDVLGLDQQLSEKVQGVSLGGTKEIFHEFIIAEWEGRIPSFIMKRVGNPDSSEVVRRFKDPMVMIRQGDHKFIKSESGKEELYDIGRDKDERFNKIGEEKIIAAELKKKLLKWQAMNQKIEHEKQSSVDELTKKNLESLGYL